MRFSIIIPHYNIPDMLSKLLDTIPNDEDIEVIVVDDKSTKELDAYSECKVRYAGRNISFYDNDTDKKGAGVCRNIGMSHASGSWLLFADSDDRFTDDFADIIRRDADGDEDIIFYHPSSINIDTGKESDRHIDFCSILDRYVEDTCRKNELSLRYELVAPWSKLIRREMITKCGILFEDSKVANDVFFCAQIGRFAQKIAVKGDTIYVVTTREGSITTATDTKSFDVRLGVFIRTTKYIRSNISKEDYRLIKRNGSYFLHLCRVNNYGIGKIISTACKLIANGISPVVF
ncbi:MAG: glycosyltransferase family 2 protein [Lachnospiraceae bacterium]|nr:glycosyltransferase family 2 protein [Candidatus Colinaster scatohippi]